MVLGSKVSDRYGSKDITSLFKFFLNLDNVYGFEHKRINKIIVSVMVVEYTFRKNSTTKLLQTEWSSFEGWLYELLMKELDFMEENYWKAFHTLFQHWSNDHTSIKKT